MSLRTSAAGSEFDGTGLSAQSIGARPAGTNSIFARYRRLSRALAVTDGLCLLAAVVVAYVVRFGFTDLPPEYALVVSFGPLLWVGVFHAHRLYYPQHLSAWDEFKGVLSASGIGAVVLATASYWSMFELSRIWLALSFFLALTFTLIARRAWRMHYARLRQRGELSYRTLIVGTNDEAARLAHALSGPGVGFAPEGYIALDESTATFNGLPIAGSLHDIREIVREHSVECLFVASSALGPDAMETVVREARVASAEVRVSANLPEMLTPRISVQPYGGVMTLTLRPVALSGTQAVAKRAFDLVVATVGLIVLSPVLGAVALALRSTSPGPILFRQQRVTKDGRVFDMLKFRTMRVDAAEVLSARGIDSSRPFFKLADDPRITRLGSFLRRTSLDELPQLINVLRGDMSIVGPRPLPAAQVAASPHLLAARHEVRSGITGWWQIRGRSEVSPEDAVRMDCFYIENWSLSLDLFILLKTVAVVAGRKGAY